jgi:Fe-S cluster assembly iron-binding protein IscA
MLTVTEGAKDKLKETLLANTDDRDAGLRLKMQPSGQLGLVLDKESPGDSVVEDEGLKLLLMEHQVAELLQDATLGVQNAPDGPKLTISPRSKG